MTTRRKLMTLATLAMLLTGTLLWLAYGRGPGSATAAAPATNPAAQAARMAWWKHARFGMFIHWGLYALPAGEWKGRKINGLGEWIMHNDRIPVRDYAQLAPQFNPTKFDAPAWVALAQNAGMKYLVITAKHHDGFAMYASKVSPYNIVDATPFKRDPLQELAAACQKAGLTFGVYYSQAQDWHEADGMGNDWDFPYKRHFNTYLHAKALPQLQELLTNYGPLGVLWFDTPIAVSKAQAEEMRTLVRTLQPACLYNNRAGPGGGDFGTPEQTIPKNPDLTPWETCMTINETWGYKKDDQQWKSSQVLIRNLVDIASKGGNYLLNVGPTAEGEIPPPSVARLQEIGAWMKINSESIYGTSMSPVGQPPWGRVTCKTDRIYMHIFAWPTGALEVPPLSGEVKGAYLLGDTGKTALAVNKGEKGLTVTLPAQASDANDTVVVLEIDGPGN